MSMSPSVAADFLVTFVLPVFGIAQFMSRASVLDGSAFRT